MSERYVHEGEKILSSPEKVVADPLDSPPITSMDPTQEWTGSEIVSRETDPVLFLLLLATDTFIKRNIGKLSLVLRS